MWLTSTFWVFHRQSPYSGAWLISPLRQDCTVAVPGATRVQALVLVFAGDPQNRLEFSQRITPPQLLTNLLPVTWKTRLNGPPTRGSAPDSDR